MYINCLCLQLFKYFCLFQDGELQVGNEITNIETVRFQLKSQFDRNVAIHMEVQEQIFDYIFSHLGIDTEGKVDHPIVLSEAFLNPNYSRHGRG